MSFLACTYCQRQFSDLSEPFYRTTTGFVCHSDVSNGSHTILYAFASDNLLTYYAGLESNIRMMINNGLNCGSLQSLYQAVLNALQMRLEEGWNEPPGQAPEEPQPWTCGNCGFSNFPTNPICYNCRASPSGEYPPIPAEAVPDLSTLSQITTVTESTGFWTCKKCEAVNSMQIPKCSRCAYVNLALLSTGALEDPEPPPPEVVSAPVQSQCWTCACGYEYNLLSSIDCYMCKSPRPGTRCDVCWEPKAIYEECQRCKVAIPPPEEVRLEEQKEEKVEEEAKEEEKEIIQEVPAQAPEPPPDRQVDKVKTATSPKAEKIEPTAEWKCRCGKKAATVRKCNICEQKNPESQRIEGSETAVGGRLEEQKEENVKEDAKKEMEVPAQALEPPPARQVNKVKAVTSPKAVKPEPAAGWNCYCGKKAATVPKCNVCGQKKPVYRCIEDCGTVVKALNETCEQCAEKKKAD